MCACSRKWLLPLNILRKHYLMLDFFSYTKVNHIEKSNVFYLNVLDAVADSKDTLISMSTENSYNRKSVNF